MATNKSVPDIRHPIALGLAAYGWRPCCVVRAGWFAWLAYACLVLGNGRPASGLDRVGLDGAMWSRRSSQPYCDSNCSVRW